MNELSKIEDRISIRKDRLMQSALSLFADHGYHAASIPIIAKEAGIATGSVYNYVSSKDELVNELFWAWQTRLMDLVRGDFPEGTARERFAHLWQRLFTFASEHPKAFQFLVSHLEGQYLEPRCRALEEEFLDFSREFVREGQASGAIRGGEPQLIVSLYMGAFVQFFQKSRQGRGEFSAENAKVLEEMCWAALQKA